MSAKRNGKYEIGNGVGFSNIVVPRGKTFDFYRLVSSSDASPQVSLVVPVYNLRKYIPEMVDSVRRQTADPGSYEVLFVDDCSTDGSFDVIRGEIGDLENGVALRTIRNGGSHATKNHGIRSSRGRHIMLLDGDDVLDPSAIESMMQFMKDNPAVKYSYSQHRKIDPKGDVLYERLGFDFSRKRLLNFNFVGAVECYERGLFDALGGYRDSYVEDYDFALRASEELSGDEISRNPKMLYSHRLHPSGKTAGIDFARNAAAMAIKDSLLRKEGVVADVKFNGSNSEKNTCFSWTAVA
jgi:glycosyltransferase involved in cell wall biosynthesis